MWGSLLRFSVAFAAWLALVPVAHAGRLFDHVHLCVSDLEASKRFYRAVAEAIGVAQLRDGEGWFSVDELWVTDDGTPTQGDPLAFQTLDRESVDRVHAAALAAGGRDNGAPG